MCKLFLVSIFLLIPVQIISLIEQPWFASATAAFESSWMECLVYTRYNKDKVEIGYTTVEGQFVVLAGTSVPEDFQLELDLSPKNITLCNDESIPGSSSGDKCFRALPWRCDATVFCSEANSSRWITASQHLSWRIHLKTHKWSDLYRRWMRDLFYAGLVTYPCLHFVF